MKTGFKVLCCAALTIGYALHRGGAAPKPKTTPILKFAAADYKKFALSKTAASYDPNDPASGIDLKAGDAQPPTLKSQGDGWAELYSASAQTLFKFPFGWRGSDDGRQTALWTEDESVRFIMSFRDIDPREEGKTSFARFKQTVRQQFVQTLRSQGQKNVRVQQLEIDPKLAPRSFALRVTGIVTSSGRRNEFVQIFTANPHQERYTMSLSLTAPSARFAHYLPLLGLLLRDRKIGWV